MAQPRLGDRTLFPKMTCDAYLAHGAISPLSEPVVERLHFVADAYARGGISGSLTCTPFLRQARADFASLIGAEPNEVAFVSNTTHGVIDIAFGITWQAGDRVLLFEDEFPANVIPWQQAAREFGLELIWERLDPFQRSAEEGLAAFERALRQGVRLVAVSAVQYKTGLRMPIEAMAALCREHDALLFSDAIQGLGATPLDVSCGVDFLSCGSHKHLMGPEGAGFLYVSSRRVETCAPRLAGWLSPVRATDFLVGDTAKLNYDKPFREDARVFETGTFNVPGLAAVGVSIELIQQFERSAIHEHVNRYHDALERGFADRGFTSFRAAEPDSRSTLLSVAPPSGVPPTALARALRERGVVSNTPDGLIRFSPHWPNSVDEVPTVLAAVDEALAEIRG